MGVIRAGLVVVVLAVLAGCGGSDTPPPIYADKTIVVNTIEVEGVPLMCARRSTGGLSCNWEAWNQAKEGSS